MRSKLFAAILLGTTALTPPAKAGPAVAFVGGIVNGAFGIGALGLTASTVGAWSVGFAIGQAAVGSFLGRLALSIGFSKLAQKLRGRPAASDPSDRLVNPRQAISYFEHGYGRTRKGGPVGFWGMVDNVRYYNVLLAAHAIAGVHELYLDERYATLDGAGYVTEDLFKHGERSRARIQIFDGSDGQGVPSMLADAFGAVVDGCDFKGLAHVVVGAERVSGEAFSQVYPNGNVWGVLPIVDLKKVYDPRYGEIRWTRNAALIIADWIVSDVGLGAQVNWDLVAEEADLADELVKTGEGVWIPKWQLDGVFNESEDREDVRAAMGAAVDAFFWETPEGEVGFKLGRYEEPTVVLTDDDFVTLNIQRGSWGPDAVSEYTATYTEPFNGYRETISGAVKVADEGRKETLALNWSHNHNQTCRVLKRLGRQAHAENVIECQLTDAGEKCKGQRFVRIEHAEAGLSGVFEVDALELLENGEGYSLEARSVTSDDFEFSAEEEPERSKHEEVAASDDVDAPADEDITAVAVQSSGGSAAIRVNVDNPPHDSFFLRTRLRRKTVGDLEEWEEYLFPQGQNFVEVRGLLDGETYQVQVWTVTGAGRASAKAPEVPIDVVAVADSTAPGALQNFAAIINGDDVDITFTAPSSANYALTEIYRADYSAGFTGTPDVSAATLVRPAEYGLPGKDDGWTDVAPGVGVHAYWARAVNGSGVPGALSGPQTIEIT